MVPEDERGRLRKLLSRYLELLLEANERLNLTAIRSWEDGVWKHLYDSLLVAPIVPRG
ncbi:MAG: class I SAM-dependent methyltransferase, partial [Bdellovibrionales bacterium]|nr:class I SAM-dependent methyltransferase [Bdellovibrionales bacterium]